MDFDVVSHVPYAVADSRENYGLPQKVRILFQLNYRKWIGHTCMQQVGALPPRKRKKRKKEKKEKRKKKRRSIATQIMMSTHMLIYRFVVLEYVPFILRLVFFFLKEWVLSEREEIDYWSKFNFFLTSKGQKKKRGRCLYGVRSFLFHQNTDRLTGEKGCMRLVQCELNLKRIQ